MRIVNISDLRKRLNAYMCLARGGEEIVITHHGVPVARILPIPHLDEGERELVASGVLKLPERAINWKKFWAIPSANLSEEETLRAVLEEREEDR